MAYAYQKELDIYCEAQLAAQAATATYLATYPDRWYPCGFAWVKIRPAQGRFVAMCKDKDLGRTDSYEGGFMIYNPSGNHTQCMDAKEAGCRAFVEVMKRHYPEMRIFTKTRID